VKKQATAEWPRRLSLIFNIPLQRLIVVWVRPHTFRFAARLLHPLGHLPKLGLVNEPVAVGIDLLETLFEPIRSFFFGDFAVLVCIQGSKQTARQARRRRTIRRSIRPARRSAFGSRRLTARLLCQRCHAPDELLLCERVVAGPL